jgi:tRNA dimethylallyltransferase
MVAALYFNTTTMTSIAFQSCWFLTGPTAAGKSGIGVEVALKLGAEIVSMDSMALYKRMDIGTAKPTAEQRAAAPHHLVDCIEPWEEYSLAQYIAAAETCAAEIARRNKKTLFVGGTPLYLKGLLRGIFEGPSADDDFRRNLTEEAAKHEPGWLHGELQKVDPASADRLHENDARRLIRALEVHHLTGRPISKWQRQFEVGRSADECKVFVLDWPREELHARIDRRVDEMFEQGLVEEVRGLVGQVANPSNESANGIAQFTRGESSRSTQGNHAKSFSPHPQPLSQKERGVTRLSKTAGQAVGYREVIDYLEGWQSLDETIELVKIHTRQLAKRQSTWFRSLSECRFIPMSAQADSRAIVEKITS